ncbi:MAG: hypothetical protein WCG25_01900 [bacterium]
MNQQIEIYRQRVKKLIELLNQQDPNWISTRTWVKAILEFELGNDFFIEFFIREDDDLTNLQNHVVTAWADNIVKQSDPKNDDELFKTTSEALAKTCLLGTEIDVAYLSAPSEEIVHQQKCLDFAWWVTMTDIIYPMTSPQYKAKLKKRAKELADKLKAN